MNKITVEQAHRYDAVKVKTLVVSPSTVSFVQDLLSSRIFGRASLQSDGTKQVCQMLVAEKCQTLC